jgi:hypothetical protein
MLLVPRMEHLGQNKENNLHPVKTITHALSTKFGVYVVVMTEVLKGKPPNFRWDPTQQSAFDTIRDRLLQGVHLTAPDFCAAFPSGHGCI